MGTGLDRTAGDGMPLWQRLLVTLIAMVVASLVVGYVWWEIFGFQLPSYLAGVVGGLTAVPVWEFLKRFRPKAAGATPPV
ncbi:MAG TPA: hypothetical protein VFZ10_20580 [Geminicoccaceae bacterium]